MKFLFFFGELVLNELNSIDWKSFNAIHTTKNLLKIIPFKLADIGEGIAEVEMIKWHVKEGDKVTQFQLLCEVRSDKAQAEITSRYDGTITKLHHKEGDIVKVGSTLVDIDSTGKLFFF